MDEIGDDFLARAAFAGDQDGDVAGGDFFQVADDHFHGLALENGGRAAAHGGQFGAQGTGLLVEALMFQGALDGEEEGFGVEGFVLEMVGPALGRFHRGVEGGMAGEDDDLGVGPLFFDLGQQFQAVAVGQDQVQQDDVGLGLREGRRQFRGAGLEDRLIALPFENGAQQVPNALGIVHHHDFRYHNYFSFRQEQARTKPLNNRRNNALPSSMRSG